MWKPNVELRHDSLKGHHADGGAGLLLKDGTNPSINAPTSLHVNDREGPNTSGSRLSQLGDTCAEDNRKLAKVFSFVLPVLGLVPSSSRVGALIVNRCDGRVLRMKMEPDSSYSPFSSDPRARICGNSAVATCGLR